MKYFAKFPQLEYPVDGRNIIIENLFKRVEVISAVRETNSAYFEYEISDGDTPEIVAHKVYGDVGLHWLVMLMNDIHSVYEDWVMTQRELEQYVLDKYGEENIYAAHHYEDPNGNIVSAPNIDLGIGYTLFNVEVSTDDVATFGKFTVWSSDIPSIYEGAPIFGPIFAEDTVITNVEVEYSSFKLTATVDGENPRMLTIATATAAEANLLATKIVAGQNVYADGLLIGTVATVTDATLNSPPSNEVVVTVSEDTPDYFGEMTMLFAFEDTTLASRLRITVDREIIGTGTGLRSYILNNVDIVPVSNLDYELRRNEKKRRIKLLRRELVPVAIRNLEDLLIGRR